MALHPFDSATYLASLTSIGQVAPGSHPALTRPIDGTDHLDVMGPWPYSPHWAQTAPEQLARHARELGAVSVVGMLPPGAEVKANEWETAGYAVRPLKEHYTFSHGGKPLTFSDRTRQHIRSGHRRWELSVTNLAPAFLQFSAFYQEMARTRNLRSMLQFGDEHFQKLAGASGISIITATDADGVGAGLITASHESGIHALHLAGAERAYKTDGFYALMMGAVDLWGKNRQIFWGGSPQGEGAEGIARFKRRFANGTAPVHLVTQVLDTEKYETLSASHGSHAWFPAYRHPDQ